MTPAVSPLQESSRTGGAVRVFPQPGLAEEILGALDVGVVVVDSSERVVLWNRWAAARAGIATERALGRSLSELFPGPASAAVRAAVRTCLAEQRVVRLPSLGATGVLPAEINGRDRSSAHLALEVAPLNGPDGRRLAVLQISDVQAHADRERRVRQSTLESIARCAEQMETLQRQATTDPLTGLLNRRGFDDQHEREWWRMIRHEMWLSLLVLDIDHFKHFNDHFGHDAGDDCLVQVAQAVDGVVRRHGDLTARYGGEEFCVLLPDTPPSGAVRLAQDVRWVVRSLEMKNPDAPGAGVVTVSVGVASTRPTRDGSPRELFRAADRAMYEAKRSGRDRVEVAPPLVGEPQPPEPGVPPRSGDRAATCEL